MSIIEPLPQRRQIVVVDDVAAKLVAMEAALAPLHRRLIRAPSGRDALATLLETDVTVILLDVWMPEMDGFETAELVRGCGAAEAAPLARNESPQLAGASSRRDAYRPDRTAHRSGSEPK